MFLALGLLLILLVVYDVYHGIVLPRQATRVMRIAPFVIGQVAWPPYRRLGRYIRDEQARDEFLGHFGVLAFFMLIFLWLVLIVLGYACIFWEIREQINPLLRNFSEAFYFAGVSILTIGFGDVVPVTATARLVTLAAGTTGLTLFGLCLSCVFNLQNLLYQREVPLAILFSRLQGKFSGLGLLLQHSKFGTVEYLRSDVRDWEKWLGVVLESHRDFPLLSFFRSTGKSECWITCLGSMLDMCNILSTCVSQYDFGECIFFHRLGSTSVQMFCRYLGLPVSVAALIDEEQFAVGFKMLEDAGFKLHERSVAWQAFGAGRREYAPYVAALCKYYDCREPQWLP